MKEDKVCCECGKKYKEGYSIAVGGEWKFDYCSMACYSSACKDKDGKLANAFRAQIEAVVREGNK